MNPLPFPGSSADMVCVGVSRGSLLLQCCCSHSACCWEEHGLCLWMHPLPQGLCSHPPLGHCHHGSLGTLPITQRHMSGAFHPLGCFLLFGGELWGHPCGRSFGVALPSPSLSSAGWARAGWRGSVPQHHFSLVLRPRVEQVFPSGWIFSQDPRDCSVRGQVGCCFLRTGFDTCQDLLGMPVYSLHISVAQFFEFFFRSCHLNQWMQKGVYRCRGPLDHTPKLC